MSKKNGGSKERSKRDEVHHQANTKNKGCPAIMEDKAHAGGNSGDKYSGDAVRSG
ncbi:hypothetical protein AGMMS49992_05610 [Clostridia bacterium]|nr:hypothetical protein AGMMS49992_05610 [Clostridia bacterium]